MCVHVLYRYRYRYDRDYLEYDFWQIYDNYSLLSTWLYMELTKTQMARYTCEGFVLIKLFEVEWSTLNPDLLR